MIRSYEEYLDKKLTHEVPTGLTDLPELGGHLFPFQRALVSWALRKGRCAIFADTGLGKTRMELEWANAVRVATGRPVVILAPLAVAAQTVREAAAIGIPAKQCREDSEIEPGIITVSNYERLHRFDCSRFGAVVCDESSIIKHHTSKTFSQLCQLFAGAAFKLCATATPAPNDFTELGTHAEFLGVCSQSEMKAEFFVHDGGSTQDWRLKGHARGIFWRWVASWGALIKKPSSLGFEDHGYDLPPLHVQWHPVHVWGAPIVEAQSLMERRQARKLSIEARVGVCAQQIAAEPHERWVVWCDLNEESKRLTAAIPGAVEVTGSDDVDEKEAALVAFSEGRTRVLVTKPSIAGFGLNWQHVARMAFVGVTDSWEAYYQAVRRCWRFGQKRPVDVHIFASLAEGAVVANLKRKEADAQIMADELSRETRDAVRSEVRGTVRVSTEYRPTEAIAVPAWLEGSR